MSNRGSIVSDTNILKHEAAMAIIKKARDDLLALGIPSLVGPTDLPQGMSVSLHVAGTEYAVYAALIAMDEGAGIAGQVTTNGV